MSRPRRRVPGVWALGAAGAIALALVGCEALLDVGSLEERSASGDASIPPDGSGAGVDSSGPDASTDTGTTADAISDVSTVDVQPGPPEDGGCTIPPGAVCAVDPQCGCPSDEKCDMPNGNAACIGYGTSPTGEPCTSSTDCKPGTTCTNGVCHIFCNDAGQPCAPIAGLTLGTCTKNAANAVQGFLCPISCTLAPNSCTDQTSCATVPLADGGFFSDCEGPGPLGSGASCSQDTDCQAGFGCDQAAQACYQWCELSPKTTTCSMGTCHSPAAVTIDGVAYGYCY